MRRVLVAFILLTSCMAITPVSAHEPNTFTMIIGEDEPIPRNITGQTLFTNDSVWFRNVDDRENITHQIRLDIDGDGFFNGTEDIISGNLSSSCELDGNGTKINDECEVVFKVLFNETTGLISGIFYYEDIRSDGITYTGKIVVNKDQHFDNVGPDPNYSTENQEDESVTHTDNRNDMERVLIVLSLSAGIASIAILMLILRPTPLYAEKYRQMQLDSEE